MEPPAPIEIAFMDGPMLKLWRKMGPMPADLRLYGGTAPALYLNHRPSTDFDSATPVTAVNPDLARRIP